MIIRIEAKDRDDEIWTWDRNTIHNTIENIPKLMELDGYWKDIKIHKTKINS